MLRQTLNQKQQFSVLPQQIQLLKLFHLNTVSLEQRIQEELNENPLLEEDEIESDDKSTELQSKEVVQDFKDADEYSNDDIPDYKLEYNNYLPDEQIPQRPITESYDFRKDLKEQTAMLLSDEREIMIMDYLIDSLNEEGILATDIVSLADDISFNKQIVIEVDEIERLRNRLKELDPMGVGCLTIKEFLVFQLQRMTDCPEAAKAIRVLNDHYDDLSHGNTDKITAAMKLAENELHDLLRLVGSCKLKPLTEPTSGLSYTTVTPDFIITQVDGGFEVNLTRYRSASLFVNQSLSKKLHNHNPNDKATVRYLKSKLTSAQWFVSAIKQRETTMLSVMSVILDLQSEYFQEGDIKALKPMILKNVADRAGVDISTVSRITCNKYADTPFGTILLKDLFSEGIQNESGELISNRVIQTAIEEVVDTEDKKNPYTDQQLVSILSMKGFSVARRTVAKYREQLRIPIAQMRGLWA